MRNLPSMKPGLTDEQRQRWQQAEFDAAVAMFGFDERTVREDERRRVEVALLRDNAIEAARDAIEAEVYAASLPGGRYSEKSLARAALQAALAALQHDDAPMTEGNHNDR